jgi:hypothetical protein
VCEEGIIPPLHGEFVAETKPFLFSVTVSIMAAGRMSRNIFDRWKDSPFR